MSTVSFGLTKIDCENLWIIISKSQVSQLHPDPGVPYAVHELRTTLQKLQNAPDDELGLGSAKRYSYCKEHKVSVNYFPETGAITWEIPKYLLVILKLVLKASIIEATGQGISETVKLCEHLRLLGWFKKTFKKPVNVDLGEDDCLMDDEVQEVEEEAEEEETEEAEVVEVPCKDEEPSAEAAD